MIHCNLIGTIDLVEVAMRRTFAVVLRRPGPRRRVQNVVNAEIDVAMRR